MPAITSQLTRQLGLFGAVGMGLGSIIGTGIFVSVGLAAGIAGPYVVVALVIGGAIGALNGLSSAQLAAAHPVTGGTYEYGYKYLNAPLGFSAGWMFLCAKTASAATAALGFAGYALRAAGQDAALKTPIAVGTAVLLTLIVLAGLRRSNVVNIAIVSVTLFSLLFLVFIGARTALGRAPQNLALAEIAPRDLFEASALMFVAFTGYARIATLGEEVHDPQKTIPRAIIIVLGVSVVLYCTVAFVAVGVLGGQRLGEVTRQSAAPLEAVAGELMGRGGALVLTIGACAAMLGVLLNLILGLSRVLLAMGRRRDMPAALAHVNKRKDAPPVAVIVVGVAVAGLAAVGNVKTTWSFSAFSVLIYYAITNLACLRLPREQRTMPRALAVVGLIGCLGLAFFVDWQVWVAGLGLIAAGLIWFGAARLLSRKS
ncbi:MAG: amino acid permease [Planctomycetes bacterium]|nr:amino acid permease [Planctomycetota bacterium]